MWSRSSGRSRLSVDLAEPTKPASLVVILLFLATCGAASPSSCGNIRNISCPFRLKGDHQKCDGSPFSYELSCDNNNRTILNLPANKYYYVEDIIYHNFSIRVVDPGLQKNNYSTRPLHSIQDDNSWINGGYPQLRELNAPVTFIDCPAPAISARYINITSISSIINSSSSSSSSSLVLEKYYSYVVLGDMKISEVENDCNVNKMTWVSLEWRRNNNNNNNNNNNITSKGASNFSSVHEGMVYGFEVYWAYLFCIKCNAGSGNCYVIYFNRLSEYNGEYRYSSAEYTCEYSCNLYHLNSYRLSLSCLRQNLHGIREYLQRNGSHIIKITGKITGYVFAGRFLCGMPFLLALLVYRMKKRHLSMYDSIENFLQGQNNLMPIRYSYSEIKKITNNFKDKLGEGGFGSVYKGKLRSGIFAAVKIMGKSKATGQEFINEVATIGRIHHVNVVQLIGFCFEGPKRALIYEFMPNGSLEKYIFPHNEEKEEEIASLSCEKMYEISSKVASGIDYLHRGCDMQFLHFDIKPHNILLDKNFKPKISDFGLARLYATNDSTVTLTAARGTMGYMAPELFYKNIGGVSYKADVYSYGMLLMEMAGRRKNLNPFVDQTSQIYFPSWVYDQFNEGKELEMEGTTEEERQFLKKMIIVALWCIQLKPGDRPSMNKVIEMLEGDVELLVMPPKPFLCPQEAPAEDEQLHQSIPELTGQSDDSITECSE